MSGELSESEARRLVAVLERLFPPLPLLTPEEFAKLQREVADSLEPPAGDTK